MWPGVVVVSALSRWSLTATTTITTSYPYCLPACLPAYTTLLPHSDGLNARTEPLLFTVHGWMKHAHRPYNILYTAHRQHGATTKNSTMTTDPKPSRVEPPVIDYTPCRRRRHRHPDGSLTLFVMTVMTTDDWLDGGFLVAQYSVVLHRLTPNYIIMLTSAKRSNAAAVVILLVESAASTVYHTTHWLSLRTKICDHHHRVISRRRRHRHTQNPTCVQPKIQIHKFWPRPNRMEIPMYLYNKPTSYVHGKAHKETKPWPDHHTANKTTHEDNTAISPPPWATYLNAPKPHHKSHTLTLLVKV